MAQWFQRRSYKPVLREFDSRRAYYLRFGGDWWVLGMTEDVVIKLTKDEALVLFDWLARFNETENQAFEDQAEQRALWNLECYFERELAEPINSDWDGIIAAARARLRDQYVPSGRGNDDGAP